MEQNVQGICLRFSDCSKCNKCPTSEAENVEIVPVTLDGGEYPNRGSDSPALLGIHLTVTYAVCKPPPTRRKPKHVIPQELRAVSADAHAQAVELRRQGKTHIEVCEELNRLGYRTRTGKPWRHPQQIIKLLRSFGGG